jgi:hypothetical protein
MLPMLRPFASALAGMLLCPPAGHAAHFGLHCAITYDDTGARDRRTIRIDTGARSVRDNEIVTVDGTANAIARNQVEFVDTGDQRVTWGSRLRATGANVFTIAIDLRTMRYTYVSHLRGLRAHGTCQPRETST